jgi:hypothetical protein
VSSLSPFSLYYFVDQFHIKLIFGQENTIYILQIPIAIFVSICNVNIYHLFWEVPFIQSLDLCNHLLKCSTFDTFHKFDSASNVSMP